MSHSLKKFWLACVLLALGVRGALGFSLIGPYESWQVNVIGYNLNPPSSALANEGSSSDVGAPKNIGQGYRYNIPTLFYTCDSTFQNYFGSNGVAAVDAAFAVLNSLTNVSSYSSNLSEWPMTTTGYNYTAETLQLVDIKSTTMSLMMEQLGLAQPDRWVWCLHDRYTGGGLVCPNYEYIVIQRNYDPVLSPTNYSSYVNGTLYDYQIIELCTLNPNPYAPLEADAVEFTPDPTTSYTAVAAYGSQLVPGTYYTGLTRDDIGGLRYLYSSTNKFMEESGPGTEQLITNKFSQLLVTSNLALLSAQSLTNGPTNLQTLYPNLVINSFTNVFSNVVTTNITAYFTNEPLNPAGTLTLVLATNFVTNVQTLFLYNFANVVTNHFYTNGFVTTQQTNIGPGGPFSPAGTIVTNVTSKTIVATNFINGDYYIVPTNLFGYQILSTQLVKIIPVTNVVVIATNAPGVVITNTQSFTMNIITYFTNYNLIVYPIELVTNTVDLREGCEKINFVRRDYDSLLGTFWDPITNFYKLTAVTNGVPFTETFRRVVTQPDFVFQASDLASGPAAVPTVNGVGRQQPRYDSSQVLTNSNGPEPGPGTLQPPVSFVFDEVGPAFLNGGPFFLIDDTKNPANPLNGDEASGSANSVFSFMWASFDGTTNAPIVYPDTISLASMESQVFFQILGTILPVGSISVNNATNNPVNPYVATLQAQGASPPFIWSVPTNSPPLPAGLSLSTNGVISGAFNTNTIVGTYDFTVQATDAIGRVAQTEFFIEVDP